MAEFPIGGGGHRARADRAGARYRRLPGSRVLYLILETALCGCNPARRRQFDPCGAGARTPGEGGQAWKDHRQDLLGMKIVDRIITEPAGGAHSGFLKPP